MVESEAALEGPSDLLEYFHSGETPEADWAVGTEHEKIGVYEATGERVPYEGEYGIGALLHRIAERDGWKPIYEGENVIALRKEGASITLEPGGQIELSGAPLRTIRETCREFNSHVDLVKRVASDFGIAWLALGADPFHDVSEIPTMPKHRYEIMRSYLPTKGSLGLDMMHASATVQANFDYSSEADMVSKLRMAMGCTPVVSAIFANSPLTSGRENGYASRRVAIWRDTDPDRCGILQFVFSENFGYHDYTEWALDVPMFFLIKSGRYVPAEGTTFRQYMESGFAGYRATLGDWDTHLTTLFPEVRLKRVIEVRGADAVPRELICALPALWKGLLYDATACAEAWTLVETISGDQRDDAQLEVARNGLGARIGGRSALELANELVAISSEGLRRIAVNTGIEADECAFLDPIRDVLERGKSPGELLLERWREGSLDSRERLIEYARY